ncbi:Glucan-binding domain-containing protein (YG repeat) [Ruminococcaceae bacterium YRB3002]|nr:Glucan-binding domain-containing protein (YG repeat) [Ruminococcaceae bacterium YRB3002]
MSIKKIAAAAMTVGMVMSFIPASVMAAKPGWDGNDDDGWYYYTSETEFVKSDWKQIGGYWYYFGNEGIMYEDGWYYIDDKFYHFDKNGHMEKNKWIDCGSLQWQDDSPDDKEYQNKREWRYVGSDGAAYTGWKKVSGVWYFFSEYDAMMFYGWHWDQKGQSYYNFDGNGKYRRNCWFKWYNSYGEIEWYYFGSDGLASTGWKKVSKKWYYFDPEEGFMWSGICEIGGKYYYLASGGDMLTGWIKYATLGHTNYWYYAGSDGALYQNQWLKSSGIWYYFDESKEMVSNTTIVINGYEYDFDASGKCTNPSGRKVEAV